MFRVLVCGGRDYSDRVALYGVLDELRAEHGMLLVIEGGMTGADALAREWARERNADVLRFDADWSRYGRNAGPIRNQQMLGTGRPDLVLAFEGGKGTADMVRRARAAGIEVQVVRTEARLPSDESAPSLASHEGNATPRDLAFTWDGRAVTVRRNHRHPADYAFIDVDDQTYFLCVLPPGATRREVRALAVAWLRKSLPLDGSGKTD